MRLFLMFMKRDDKHLLPYFLSFLDQIPGLQMITAVRNVSHMLVFRGHLWCIFQLFSLWWRTLRQTSCRSVVLCLMIFLGLLFNRTWPQGVFEDDSCPFLSPLQPDVSVLLPLDDPAMHQPLSANMGLSMRGLEIFY